MILICLNITKIITGLLLDTDQEAKTSEYSPTSEKYVFLSHSFMICRDESSSIFNTEL
jgi:hypothetical protein